MVRTFQIGEVFGKSFKVLCANFVPFICITAMVQIPLILYAIYFALGLRSVRASEAAEYSLTGSLIMVALAVFFTPVATGAVTFGTVQHLRGKTASVGECISVGVSRLFPVLGVAISSGLLIVLGMVALIIPGLIVACMLYVAVPAAVIERAGIGAAIKRSSGLTKGFRWRIFCIIFILGVIEKVSGKLLEVALLKDAESFLIFMLASLAVGIVIAAWQASAAAVSYYYLRSMKESVDIEEIAAVFD